MNEKQVSAFAAALSSVALICALIGLVLPEGLTDVSVSSPVLFMNIDVVLENIWNLISRW